MLQKAKAVALPQQPGQPLPPAGQEKLLGPGARAVRGQIRQGRGKSRRWTSQFHLLGGMGAEGGREGCWSRTGHTKQRSQGKLPRGPSQARNGQEKGHLPRSSLILPPRLHLPLLPHVLRLPPDPPPLSSLCSLLAALLSQPPATPCRSQRVPADTSPAAGCFLPKGRFCSRDCAGREGAWGSTSPSSARPWLLQASLLLRTLRRVRGGLKSRQVLARMPGAR